jgi:hypothetical protein
VTYNQPSYPGFYLASDTDRSIVSLLTKAATPAAVTFADNRGSKNDTRTIPAAVEGLRYVVKGKVAEEGTYRVTGNKRADVSAVAAGKCYFIPAGVSSQWSHKFGR